MKVYLLVQDIPYQGNETLGVYSTEALANDAHNAVELNVLDKVNQGQFVGSTVFIVVTYYLDTLMKAPF